MKTIAIVSQKGGAGKTSLAINLAAAALESNLSAVIADTDTQQSAYNWFKERAVNTLPYVISSYPDSLPAYIETARQEGALSSQTKCNTSCGGCCDGKSLRPTVT